MDKRNEISKNKSGYTYLFAVLVTLAVVLLFVRPDRVITSVEDFQLFAAKAVVGTATLFFLGELFGGLDYDPRWKQMGSIFRLSGATVALSMSAVSYWVLSLASQAQ